MPVSIDNKTYQIDQKLLKEIEVFAESEYLKLDEGLRFAGKAISREILRRMEKNIREKTKDEEKARSFRPDKKEDATLFLMGKMFRFIGLFLENATICITTDESGEAVTGLSIENQARGSLASDGDIGVR